MREAGPRFGNEIAGRYTGRMDCAICRARRSRRFCPGVRGEICTRCCGTEREVTVDCPLDCEFLQQARLHEKPVPVDHEQVPHRDIRIPKGMLDEYPELEAYLRGALARAAMNTPGAVDRDVREALDALIQTYRTLESGVIYESVPANPLAAGISRFVGQSVTEFRRLEHEHFGIARTRDGLVLAYLVLLRQEELNFNNGRPRSRAFISMLVDLYGGAPPSTSRASSSLILR